MPCVNRSPAYGNKLLPEILVKKWLLTITRTIFPFCLIALLLLTVCGAETIRPSHFPPLPINAEFSSPTGEVLTSRTGDTIIISSKAYEYPAIHLKRNAQSYAIIDKIFFGSGIYKGPDPERNLDNYTMYTVPAQYLILYREDDNWVYYSGLKVTEYIKETEEETDTTSEEVYRTTQTREGGLKKHKAGKYYRIWVSSYASSYTTIVTPPPIEETTVYARNYPRYRMELVYDGKSDNIVQFLYKEYVHKYMQEAFTYRFRHDLDTGNIVEFKGAKIEVISATENELTYRVLKNFPAPNDLSHKLDSSASMAHSTP